MSDDDLGGYHLVWTRDMCHSATGLLAAGRSEVPLRALIYLACTQKEDGGFYQNFWLETLGEAEQVLQGKALIPFWRGKAGERGVNLRRVFTEMPTFDPIEWLQGTAATPYLEQGPLTKLADPLVGTRLNNRKMA